MSSQHANKTVRGYDVYEVVSAMQKAIRRADVKLAGYFAIELFESYLAGYCWQRLLVISAEDCADIITKEIMALHHAFTFVNQPSISIVKGQKPGRGRVFIAKAVIILCEAKKSRAADHLTNFIYDQNKWLSDQMMEEYFFLVRQEREELPPYTFDVHTRVGKYAGKTKRQFFKEEQAALTPKKENDLFKNITDD